MRKKNKQKQALKAKGLNRKFKAEVLSSEKVFDGLMIVS